MKRWGRLALLGRLVLLGRLALLALLGSSARPGLSASVDERVRRIDRLLDEAGRMKHSRELRARFGQQALDELTPLLKAAPSDAELHYLAALGWIAVAHKNGPLPLDAEKARNAHTELAAVRALAPEGGRAEDVEVEEAILYSQELRYEDALAAYLRATSIHALGGPYAAGETLEHGGARGALLDGNSAEILMALGRLDEAIAAYRRALAHAPPDAVQLASMPHYGLAVALDRDGQEARARAEMHLAVVRDPELGELHNAGGPDGSVFFVPPGDQLYYVALAELSRGKPEAAAASLNAFLATAPRPRWAARARAHLHEIEAQKNAPRR